MEKEAKEHGFRISSHPALIATKPLAYFERTRNGKNQMFEITEYRIFPEKIFLRGLRVMILLWDTITKKNLKNAFTFSMNI